jgi:signal transduction histidine kinase
MPPDPQERTARRRARVLSVILASVIVLVSGLLISTTYETMTAPYAGTSAFFFAGLDLLYLALWALNRRGRTPAAAAVFLVSFFFIILSASADYGASMPAGLLAYALFITMATATTGARGGFAALAASVAGIWAVGLSEHGAGIIPYWKLAVIEIPDLFVYSVILCVGGFFAWFLNREVERSLARAYASEDALRGERDRLEETVEERTRAWKQAELGRSAELARLAEFGKLSAGLVHDLLNPLTAISLSVQALEGESSALGDARGSVEAAMRAARRIEEHIALTRKHLKPQRASGPFDARDELRDVVRVLGHAARKGSIALELDAPNPLPLEGDALAFYQAYANIVLNAIESFDAERPGRFVRILARADASSYVISVEDNGSGMGAAAKAKAFDPFYTTKEGGIGLGLSVAKDAIAEFGGTIEYADRAGGGTECRTRIPFPKP